MVYIYHFNKLGIYTGKNEALENPMYKSDTHSESDRYLYNKGTSTLKAPSLTYADKETEIFDLNAREWIKKADYRGTAYYEKDGTERKIDKIGENIPDGCLVDPPPTPYHTSHDGNSWQMDMDKVKSELLQKAFEKRKEIETSGVDITDVSCVDFRLSTDDKGQTKISNAYYEAKELLGSAETTDWYTLSGWREVTNADIIVMAKAVRSHVKNTFSEMRRIQEEIEALESIEEIENYEINFDYYKLSQNKLRRSKTI